MTTATTATTATTSPNEASKTASKTVIALLGLALAGCVPLLGTVHYEDLDALVLDATGKHVYEPLAEHDVQRLEHKVQYARRGDLERIIAETENIVRTRIVEANLTPDQRSRTFTNLDIALERVLRPEMERRNAAARRRMRLDGCSSADPDAADAANSAEC